MSINNISSPLATHLLFLGGVSLQVWPRQALSIRVSNNNYNMSRFGTNGALENVLLVHPTYDEYAQGALVINLLITLGQFIFFKQLTKIPAFSLGATSDVFSSIRSSCMHDHRCFLVSAVVRDNTKTAWSKELIGEAMCRKVRRCYTLSLVIDRPV